MNKLSVTINAVLACALFFALVAFILPGLDIRTAVPAAARAGLDDACDTGRAIQVSGTAVVNVTPDRVLIQLGVESNGKTPQKTESANSATIKQVTQSLLALGVEEKDIVTDWYVIKPVYQDYGSLVIKGYRIDNLVAVTLRDISKVNRVIIAALEGGANQVVNVEFYLSNLRQYRDQARELAMEAAREKADDLAAAAGAEADCVMNINENSWSYYNGGWYGQNRDLWTQNTVQNVAPAGGEAGALSDDGPLNLGQIAVRAEVSASFSLR